MNEKVKNNTMEMKRAIVPFDCKNEADASSDMGKFSGYGSVFGNIDFGGDIVVAGAFEKSLQKWQAKNAMPAMLGFHNSTNYIGDWITMREDEKGLFVSGQFWVKGDRRIEDAVRAHNIARGTAPKGLSIGYFAKEFEMVEFNGGMVRKLLEVELMEVSVVGFGMNDQALIENVKSKQLMPTKRDIEKALREVGLSNRLSKAFIAVGYGALEQEAKRIEEDGNRDDSLDLSGVLKSLQTFSNRIT